MWYHSWCHICYHIWYQISYFNTKYDSIYGSKHRVKFCVIYGRELVPYMVSNMASHIFIYTCTILDHLGTMLLHHILFFFCDIFVPFLVPYLVSCVSRTCIEHNNINNTRLACFCSRRNNAHTPVRIKYIYQKRHQQ